MAAGGDTFIHDMITRAGFTNVLSNTNRYPELSFDDIRELAPDVVFLSSEPYPFKEEHIKEIEKILPGRKIMLVDGEMFSWYGSRLIKSAQYFKQLVHDLNVTAI